ncbi:hypothetical protein AX777_20545 [Sphingobium yanoikuyae]|uniref:Alpha/beta hydrolase fold-3 domain-containing protein n=1 Tax=Sphingobium yanoikuyae TaxID=13690 RepID=A0A177JU35_SPHYA|nr:alpha/beta hydrolase [Sphingobium yanoikuyae]OAH44663.1 hypothetical protein AX777_20545 [Sphingobium yanoikuyae]
MVIAGELDPDLAAFLSKAGPAASLSGETSVEAFRARFARRPAGTPETVASVHDVAASGVNLRVYDPQPANPGKGALLFFHGGGFIIGDLEQQDGFCRLLANRVGIVVVSVDYRLAPEHPYPAAIEDGWSALGWLSDNARQLGVDPARLAVGGTSAGASLAAALCLVSRDRGGPSIAFQLLPYPATDLRPGAWPETSDTLNPVLPRETAEWFASLYLSGGDPAQAYASPLVAADLSRLPPAFILTAEFDPLRDEAEAYGARLRSAGVEVSVKRYTGMTHMFLSFAAAVPAAARAIDDIVNALRAAIVQPAAAPSDARAQPR